MVKRTRIPQEQAKRWENEEIRPQDYDDIEELEDSKVLSIARDASIVANNIYIYNDNGSITAINTVSDIQNAISEGKKFITKSVNSQSTNVYYGDLGITYENSDSATGKPSVVMQGQAAQYTVTGNKVSLNLKGNLINNKLANYIFQGTSSEDNYYLGKGKGNKFPMRHSSNDMLFELRYSLDTNADGSIVDTISGSSQSGFAALNNTKNKYEISQVVDVQRTLKGDKAQDEIEQIKSSNIMDKITDNMDILHLRMTDHGGDHDGNKTTYGISASLDHEVIDYLFNGDATTPGILQKGQNIKVIDYNHVPCYGAEHSYVLSDIEKTLEAQKDRELTIFLKITNPAETTLGYSRTYMDNTGGYGFTTSYAPREYWIFRTKKTQERTGKPAKEQCKNKATYQREYYQNLYDLDIEMPTRQASSSWNSAPVRYLDGLTDDTLIEDANKNDYLPSGKSNSQNGSEDTNTKDKSEDGENGNKKKDKLKWYWILAIVLGALTVVIGVILIIYFFAKKKKKEDEKKGGEETNKNEDNKENEENKKKKKITKRNNNKNKKKNKDNNEEDEEDEKTITNEKSITKSGDHKQPKNSLKTTNVDNSIRLT